MIFDTKKITRDTESNLDITISFQYSLRELNFRKKKSL